MFHSKSALDKPCGGLFNESSGFVTSPDEDFNAKYDYNLDCLYEFRARPSFVISLHFEVLDLEPDPKCSYDYIEVKYCYEVHTNILCVFVFAYAKSRFNHNEAHVY